MAYKDKEKAKLHYRKYKREYYRNNESAREKNKAIFRLNYWRKKYCNLVDIELIQFRSSHMMEWDEKIIKQECEEFIKNVEELKHDDI